MAVGGVKADGGILEKFSNVEKGRVTPQSKSLHSPF